MNIDEHITTKGEIVHHEQFLLLSQCFKKPSSTEASESVCMWETVNTIIIKPIRLAPSIIMFFKVKSVFMFEALH